MSSWRRGFTSSLPVGGTQIQFLAKTDMDEDVEDVLVPEFGVVANIKTAILARFDMAPCAGTLSMIVDGSPGEPIPGDLAISVAISRNLLKAGATLLFTKKLAFGACANLQRAVRRWLPPNAG